MNWIIEKIIALLSSKLLSKIQFRIESELMDRDRIYTEAQSHADRNARKLCAIYDSGFVGFKRAV